MNMPGAHWFNALIGTVFGFSDRGFQRANLLILLITMVLIFMWLRSFSNLTAITGSLLVGVFFFQYGPAMSLQREFITLPFLLASLIIFPLTRSQERYWKFLLVGILVSCSVLIKPQSGLILVIFVGMAFLNHKQDSHQPVRTLLPYFAIMGMGFLVPLIMTVLHFLLNNSLNSFLEIAFKYWPLYNQINARLEITPGGIQPLELIKGIQSIGSRGLWLLPAVMGLFVSWKDSPISSTAQSKVLLIAGGAFVSFIEVIVANKYWEYHWFPMLFFLIMLSALALAPFSQQLRLIHVWVSIGAICLIAGFNLRPSVDFWMQTQAGSSSSPQGGRVDEISHYLKENLDPDDTVQPLDWTNGAVQSMLEARVRPASRYLYDFYFYHHVSNPEIQFIRQDLIKQLDFSKPKVIIQFYDGRPWVSGMDTTRDFPELQQFLAENYYVDKDKNGYRLWMRK